MDTGDTAWVLASAALVLLMTPGLALFYGGMVRAKSVLNMMMMSFGALALISVLWVLYGYSMAFGNDVGGGLVGSPTEFFGLSQLLGTAGVDKGFAATHLVFTIPALAFVAFQAVFAIITSGRLCGRIGSRRHPTRLPSTIARARPAAPALMCTAVPPAKSIASSLLAIQPPVLDWAPLNAKTQCATGK